VLRLAEYAELESILTSLRTAGCEVVGMNLRQIDLEEVFIQIMGQETRP
jgi:site-specific recombinase XerC